MSDLVSVILPVYNAEKYLPAAVESVLSQTYANFELILIDDGSTDSSATLIASLNDKRIKKYFNERNIGLIATLNKAIALCNGEFIARMDADDLCHPDRFEKQVAFLSSGNSVSVCGTWFTLFDETGLRRDIKHPITHQGIKFGLLFHSTIGHPSVMFRKKVVENMDGEFYRAHFKGTEDYELWTRLVLNNRFANVPVIGLDYRIHSKQESVVKNEIQLALSKEIRRNYLQSIFPQLQQPDQELYVDILDANYYYNSRSSGLLKHLQRLSGWNNSSKAFGSFFFLRKMLYLFYLNNKKRLKKK